MAGQKDEKQYREEILKLVREYAAQFHSLKKYEKGGRVPYAGRVYDGREMTNLVDASLDFWLTAGRYAGDFEKKFAKFLGIKYCALVNSGSSANLLAFMALTSPLLGERRVKKGDEVITVAAGFPTTVAPVVQFGAVPVFIDVSLPQYNADVSMLEKALSKKTKAVMLAHTLGNPFDIKAAIEFCKKYGLWLIEDNCDALGSKYTLNGVEKYTGTFGDIGTSSFYPPHHMTMGEGGAVYTDDALLSRIVFSLRDWGRDCVCPSGRDDTCGHRFDRQYGELPKGYDHKYVYSHFGYNLKATEMQAAIGCAQLEKLPAFIESRRKNWQFLRDSLAGLKDRLILPEPEGSSKPSWFGFLITVKKESGLSREKMVRALEKAGVQTRMLFAGNLVKHPCFDGMRISGEGYRAAVELKNTDAIMYDTFWVGVYPGMNEEMLSHISDTIKKSAG